MRISAEGSINPHNMKKSELVEFLTKRCKHGHKYFAHPACWLKEKNIEKKVGYLDIESGGLNANFDYMLSYVIKTRNKDEYYFDVINRNDIISYNFDKRILKHLIEDLLKYDIIVTYYGTRFDIPFIRSRALCHNLKFPVFGYVQHKDVYYMVRNKLKLHKSSLDSACAFLGIKGKDHIKGNLWMKAKIGNKKALGYVLNHNKKDVEILEKLHKKLEVFARNTTKSI